MAKSYKRIRREEYPSVGDQLDAIWKMLEPEDGSEAQDIKDKINAIKSSFPKPEA